MGSFKKKVKTKKKKKKLKSKKKKIIIKLLHAGQWPESFDYAHSLIQHNFQSFIIFYL